MTVNISEYRDLCRRQAMTHGIEHGFLYDRGVNLTDDEQRRCYEHGVQHWAALYGCAPAILDTLRALDRWGTPAFKLDPVHASCAASLPGRPARQPEHTITEGWGAGLLAVDRLGTDLRVLNHELRGVSRALWLAVLWSGRDPSSLRSRWYHPSDLGRYWVAAYEAQRLPGTACLIQYGRALVWRYAELSTRGHTHAAHTIIEAAADLFRPTHRQEIA